MCVRTPEADPQLRPAMVVMVSGSLPPSVLCVCVYVCIVCMCVCVYVCMRVCVYVCMCSLVPMPMCVQHGHSDIMHAVCDWLFIL